jgi:hypothetical protein
MILIVIKIYALIHDFEKLTERNGPEFVSRSASTPT